MLLCCLQDCGALGELLMERGELWFCQEMLFVWLLGPGLRLGLGGGGARIGRGVAARSSGIF